jgi:GAF domain-containing protein
MRTIKGEAMVMTPKTSMLHNLNEIGTRIFEALDGRRTAAQIVDVLLGEYDVDRATLEKDIFEYLDILHERGLIVKE